MRCSCVTVARAHVLVCARSCVNAPPRESACAMASLLQAVVPLQVTDLCSTESAVVDDSWQLSVRVPAPASLKEPPTGESEHPTAPLGGPVDKTAMPGAAGPETGPASGVPYPLAGAMRPAPMPLIAPSDGTGERSSTSVVVELASPLASAPRLPGGPVFQLRVRSNGSAQDREI